MYHHAVIADDHYYCVTEYYATPAVMIDIFKITFT